MNVKELSEALKPYIYEYGQSYAFIIFIFTKHIILTGGAVAENTNTLKVNIKGEEDILRVKVEKLVDKIGKEE